jgi:hypothetical protein
MQLFCPSCQSAFGGTEMCPKCGDRLIAPQESQSSAASSQEPAELPDLVRPTLGGRVFLGTLISLGLMIAFGELSTAFWGPSASENAYFLRILAVAFGSLLAGSGQTRGLIPGFIVGLVFAGLLLIADRLILEETVWRNQLLGFGFFPVIGLIGGLLGSRIWPVGLELLSVETHSTHASVRSHRTGNNLASKLGLRNTGRPTIWMRVLLGALLGFSSVVASEAFRTILARGSLGYFNMGGVGQAGSMGAQVAAIFLFLSGCIAGANTGAGLRHGFYTAILALLGLFLASSTRADGFFPPVAGLFHYLGLPATTMFEPMAASVVSAVVIVLVTLGGCLGGQLFPTLVPAEMRNRKHHLSV